MTKTSIDAERIYDDHRFSAREIFRTERMKVICGYFKPGQFIPVHAPESDVAIHVQEGSGLIRDGEEEHRVEPADLVVVGAGTKRGIKADEDTKLETLLVTAPPPSDAEHEPVRQGLQRGEFEPEQSDL